MAVSPRDTYNAYLDVQDDFTVELKKVLAEAARNVEESLLKASGKSVSEVFDRASKRVYVREINSQLSSMFTDAQAVIDISRGDSAVAAVEAFGEYERDYMERILGRDGFLQYIETQAAQARGNIDSVMKRLMGKSYTPLAKSVYKTEQYAQGLVDRYVDMALVRGYSAREFAKGVASMINPKVPGGVSYAAMRLARTEINNAFHATSLDRYLTNDAVVAVDWNLSSSHPGDDDCDALAKASPYDKEKVPLKPHPNCFCYVTPTMMDEEAYFRWLNEKIDAAVEEVSPGGVSEALKRVEAAELNDDASRSQFFDMFSQYEEASWDDEEFEKTNSMYVGQYFGSDNSWKINNYLRTGEPASMKANADRLTGRDWWYSVPDDTVTYRAVSDMDFPTNMVGTTYKDNGFMSTSTDAQHVLKMFDEESADKTMFKVLVPGETKIMMYEDEQEILLKNGSSLLIVGDKMEGGIRWLTAVLNA